MHSGVRNQNQTIGVIVPAAFDYGREVLRGVRIWCTEHPGTQMAVISESGYREKMSFPADPPDCLVAFHSVAGDLNRLRARCPNLVVTSNREPLEGFVRVISDDPAVGRMGAEHLLALGYRSLAFVGPPDFNFARERAAGFLEVVEAAGAECPILPMDAPQHASSVLARLFELPGPVGVMAASDLHVRFLVDALEEPASAIPDRLALIGVDDDSLQNALSPVPLSSVALSGERVGYEAAKMGMRLAAGESAPAEAVRIAPKHVINRRSTDALAVRDRLVARTLRLIRDRIGEIPDAAALVKAVGVSRRTLESRFRKVTGRTLAGDLTRSRIRRARELLATTGLSGKEIAFLVGFSEPRMLSLVFRRETGERPTDYRKRVRPGD
jgi:LacI family transcriptional regulator